MSMEPITVLNNKQRDAVTLMKAGKNVFITGPAGTGKSVTIKDYARQARVILTSTTGVSAVLIGGCTMHSYFGIGLGHGSATDIYKNVIKYRKTDAWTTSSTVIIDEISMLDCELFEKLDIVGRAVRRCDDKPFGGLHIVACGDFAQLPAVQSKRYCFQSPTWSETFTHTVYLSDIIRQNDPEFTELLNNIRLGRSYDVSMIESMTYENRIERGERINLDEYPQLFAVNAKVDQVNTSNLARLLESSPAHDYNAKVTIFARISNANKPQIINGILNDMRIDPAITLCDGLRVMVTHNIDVQSGVANGSLGTIVGFVRGFPEVRMDNGLIITVSEVVRTLVKNGEEYASVRALPLKLAYAFTIHKMQGITLDRAFIDLMEVFENGQTYVALSRVKSATNLIIRNYSENQVFVSDVVRDYYAKLESDM